MRGLLALGWLVACPAPPSAPSPAPVPEVAAPSAPAREPALDGPHLVVLGVAQDAGHPQAGCTKACCARSHDDPAARHRVVSLGLIDGDHRVLIEATPDLPSQLRDLSPDGRLDGIFVTHGHIGHYAGLVHLGREAMGADAVPVHAMPRMRAFLEADRPWSLLVDHGHVRLVDLVEGEAVQASPSVRITAFTVPHRDEVSETVGFRIQGPTRTVAFVPDIDKWSRWDRPVEELVRSVDVALVDGTFYADGEIARDMALIPHPFVEESVQRLSPLPGAERRKVTFIHFNHTNPLLDPSSDAHARVLAAGFSVARGGQRLPL